MNASHRIGAPLALGLLVALVAVPRAHAGPCAAAKLQVTGKRAAAALGCHAKAVGKGAALDTACVAASGQQFDGAFAKADAKADCAATGDGATVAARVATVVGDVTAALGAPGPSACTKLKLLAAGKAAATKLACIAKANKKTFLRGVDPKCLVKASAKLAQAFHKGEAKGDCLAPGGDTAAIEALLDALLVGARSTLAPPRTTCAPVAPTALHGDGFLPNNRLARIVKGKVPCVHGEDLTTTKCVFSTTPGSESGIWLESPAGLFAKTGQAIAKDGQPNGDYIVAADVATGPAPCLEPTGMDTVGRIPEGTELAVVCTVEDILTAYNATSAELGWSPLSNMADGIVCSADAVHPDGAYYLGHEGLGDAVYCYAGQGASLNDINGTERDWLGQYFNGPEFCHSIVVSTYEVPGAKRPATRTLPAPGSVKTNTTIVWRPVSSVNIANVGNPPPRTPTPTPDDAPTETPTGTATPVPTPTVTPEPDFVVDTTADDVALADCDGDTPADCSLRGALVKAAGRLDPTRIALPAGTYVLTGGATCQHVTRQYGTQNLPGTSSLCLKGNVTLSGAGAATTVIDGNDTDRVLLVGNGGPVRVESVTLRGGHQEGSAPFGGGGAVNNGGDLTLVDCVVTASSATATGGAIYSAGTLALERCAVTDNTARSGGGIATESFHAPVDATIVDSTIADNRSTTEMGGGLFVYGGNAGGTTIIRGSTIARNEALSTGGGGIGVAGIDSTLVLVNSTLSANRAWWYYGGALGDFGRSQIQLRNVTVTANRSEDATGANGAGGGLSIDATSTVTLANTIVAGNSAPDFAPDCYDGEASFVSAGYNLIGDQGGAATGGTYCDLGGDGTGDLLGVDPLLGPLADNGGPTLTHALLAGSPAIDAGDPAGCTDETSTVLATDQRGAPRPADGDGDTEARCDRGAVESP